MDILRKGSERGRAVDERIDSWYSFSFGSHSDPRYPHYSALCVLNEERFAPGTGYPEHPHRDIEIVTYMLSGSLRHEDSLGNHAALTRGDVQRLSAGTGLTHSEVAVNGSGAHLLQIWLSPSRGGLVPDYEVRTIADDEKRNHPRLIGSPEGRGQALTLHADVSLYALLLDTGKSVRFETQEGRRYYLHVALGSARANGHVLNIGDALLGPGGQMLELQGAPGGGELLLFDLP